jgi:hypothetical protein
MFIFLEITELSLLLTAKKNSLEQTRGLIPKLIFLGMILLL